MPFLTSISLSSSMRLRPVSRYEAEHRTPQLSDLTKIKIKTKSDTCTLRPPIFDRYHHSPLKHHHQQQQPPPKTVICFACHHLPPSINATLQWLHTICTAYQTTSYTPADQHRLRTRRVACRQILACLNLWMVANFAVTIQIAIYRVANQDEPTRKPAGPWFPQALEGCASASHMSRAHISVTLLSLVSFHPEPKMESFCADRDLSLLKSYQLYAAKTTHWYMCGSS